MPTPAFQKLRKQIFSKDLGLMPETEKVFEGDKRFKSIGSLTYQIRGLKGNWRVCVSHDGDSDFSVFLNGPMQVGLSLEPQDFCYGYRAATFANLPSVIAAVIKTAGDRDRGAT